MSTNISKKKRDDLLDKIKQIRAFIAAAPQDENTGNLLSYLSELEKDVNGKKYGLVFEEHREEIDEVLDTHTPVLTEDADLFIDHGGQMNFLLEGDNLAALKLLEKTHRGKIDLIYIDPPYNTGNKDFIYDDAFVDKHIQDYYNYELEVNHVSANTVKHRHANIHKAFAYAYKTDLIQSNPADKVELPKIEKYSGQFYNQKQIENLIRVVKGDPIEFGVITASFYGLRRSEVLGLKWDAIDFENKTITIRHTVHEVTIDGKTRIVASDTTKTKSSYRSLPLVKPFEEILLRMKQEQEENKRLCGRCYCQDYLDYIYVNQIGEIVKPGFVTAHFSAVLKANNLPHIRFHDLRHSCASLLFAQGVSLKEIQAWLGHSTIGTTANIYTHLDENNKLSSANAIIAILPEM